MYGHTHTYKYTRVLAHTRTHALLPDLQLPLMLTHAHMPCPTRRVRVEVQAAAPGRSAYDVAEEHAAGNRPEGDLLLHRKEARLEPREPDSRAFTAARLPLRLPLRQHSEARGDVLRGVPPGVLQSKRSSLSRPSVHTRSAGEAWFPRPDPALPE